MIPSAFHLQQLVQETHKSEAEVIALAVQAGLRKLGRVSKAERPIGDSGCTIRRVSIALNLA